jgi:hypothetical protein
MNRQVAKKKNKFAKLLIFSPNLVQFYPRAAHFIKILAAFKSLATWR